MPVLAGRTRTVEGEGGGLVGRLGPAHAAVAAMSRRREQHRAAEEQEQRMTAGRGRGRHGSYRARLNRSGLVGRREENRAEKNRGGILGRGVLLCPALALVLQVLVAAS